MRIGLHRKLSSESLVLDSKISIRGNYFLYFYNSFQRNYTYCGIFPPQEFCSVFTLKPLFREFIVVQMQ